MTRSRRNTILSGCGLAALLAAPLPAQEPFSGLDRYLGQAMAKATPPPRAAGTP